MAHQVRRSSVVASAAAVYSRLHSSRLFLRRSSPISCSHGRTADGKLANTWPSSWTAVPAWPVGGERSEGGRELGGQVERWSEIVVIVSFGSHAFQSGAHFWTKQGLIVIVS